MGQRRTVAHKVASPGLLFGLLLCIGFGFYRVYNHAGVPHKRSMLLSSFKQLFTVCHIYASDHDDRLPPASRWADATLAYARNPMVYRDPDSNGEVPRYHAAFAAGLGGRELAKISEPLRTVLFYESKQNRWNQTGGRDDLAPPRPTRGEPGHVFGFVDGHVAAWTLERQRSGDLIWP